MNVIHNGSWLDEQMYAPPTWVVSGLVPQGCCILAGHPKIGKSYLVLGLALAVASGQEVLGVQVDQRPVLYLALEDPEARIQKRARQLLDDEALPEEFYFISRTHQSQALEAAQQWVVKQAHRQPLVIVDTLEKIRGPRTANGYSDDYKAGGLLQTMEAAGGAVIAVHHSRKNASEDFLEEVSGTLGLAGSVDTVITLKRKRTDTAATLSVTGRDVDEMSYSLTFTDGKWHPSDGALTAAADKAKEIELSDGMLAVADLVNSRTRTTASDVVQNIPNMKEATARQYLNRLANQHGLIHRIDTGVFGPVTVSQLSQPNPSEGVAPPHPPSDHAFSSFDAVDGGALVGSSSA
ncbi:hypothetical protein MMEU_4218 [Mycobacterium marinum str. Europe]|nr:hypothetical protein MMEU_4218 [Mycobacterium marinum str. Europe]